MRKSKCCNADIVPITDETVYGCVECRRNCNGYGFETWYGTIVRSDEWRKWEEVAEEKGFDVSESREAGILSDEHWSAFVEFMKTLPKKK